MDNNIITAIRSKDFKKLDQFQKRELLHEHILTEDKCCVGLRVMCYDIETYVNPKAKYFYARYSIKKIGNMTIGKVYVIEDYRGSNKIKLTNDIGKQHWYQIRRFIHSIKIERRNKLKQINKNNPI